VIGTLIGLGMIGTLFASGLMIYEIFFLKLTFTTVPACVYGLVLYLGILTTGLIVWKSLAPSNRPNNQNTPTP
jgi:hypothetical protein